MTSKGLSSWLAILLVALVPQCASAQPGAAEQPPAGQLRESLAAAAPSVRTSDPPATLRYANRDIVEFRATVLARTPSARAAVAARLLDTVVAAGVPARVTRQVFEEGALLSAGSHRLFVIWPADVDELAGESLEQKSADTAARLQVVVDEALELRTPARLVTPVALTLGATLLYAGALLILIRTHRAASTGLSRTAQRQLERLPAGEIVMKASGASTYARRGLVLVSVVLALVVTDAWLTFVLRRFPYTRPWGETLRSALLSSAASIGRHVMEALPDLLVVLVIVLITRFLTRLVTLVFEAVEKERLLIPWLFPETAQPTRRIAVALLWLFALIVSYSYLPGSNSDAFKGVSVFVGLVVSLGSTGIMNQVMSGLTITYSRALRVGDFVKIGDLEGIVTHLGTLSTKIKTIRNEEITIPNAIVVSNATTNYTRNRDEGVFVPTSVTIGYDVPWRQVHALLLMAAGRTSGILAAPEPVVRQTALRDCYVNYTLLVCLEQPHLRGPVLDALHANIQDAFNEYGVQIMSPAYEADPSGPKVVPPDRWYAAPATQPAATHIQPTTLGH